MADQVTAYHQKTIGIINGLTEERDQVRIDLAKVTEEKRSLKSSVDFKDLQISQSKEEIYEQCGQLAHCGREINILRGTVSHLHKDYGREIAAEKEIRETAITEMRAAREELEDCTKRAHGFGEQLRESEQRSQNCLRVINQLLNVVAEAHCLTKTASKITASSFGEFGEGLDGIRRSINMLECLDQVTDRSNEIRKSRKKERANRNVIGAQAMAATLPLVENARKIVDSKLCKTSKTKGEMQQEYEDAKKSLKDGLIKHDKHVEAQPADFQQAVSKERDASDDGTPDDSSTDMETDDEESEDDENSEDDAEDRAPQDVDHRDSGEDMNLDIARDQGEETLVTYEDSSGLGHIDTANEDQVMGGAGTHD